MARSPSEVQLSLRNRTLYPYSKRQDAGRHPERDDVQDAPGPEEMRVQAERHLWVSIN